MKKIAKNDDCNERPRRRSRSTPGLGTLAAAASTTACTVELSRSSGGEERARR